MNKKLIKHAASFLLLLVMIAPAWIAVNAQQGDPTDYFQGGAVDLTLPGQESQIGIVGTVVKIVNVVLGLLGLLAVIIILYGGFLWMTAQGVEEKVDKARDTIRYGLIGLAIILLAYLVVRVVISSVVGFGNSPGTWNPS